MKDIINYGLASIVLKRNQGCQAGAGGKFPQGLKVQGAS